LITSFDKSTPGETVPVRPPVPVAVTGLRGAGSADTESTAPNERAMPKKKPPTSTRTGDEDDLRLGEVILKLQSRRISHSLKIDNENLATWEI
jgi:hypothetical protein